MIKPITLTLFTKQYCGLCAEAYQTLLTVQRTTPFQLVTIDIEDPLHKAWKSKYVYDIPVVHINDQPAMLHHIDPVILKKMLVKFQESSTK